LIFFGLAPFFSDEILVISFLLRASSSLGGIHYANETPQPYRDTPSRFAFQADAFGNINRIDIIFLIFPAPQVPVSI
jgi:hypothetical protein